VAKPGQSSFARLLGFARPYLGLILLTIFFAGLYAGGRSLQMYLLKPLLDGVLLPQYAQPASAATSHEWSWSFRPWSGPRVHVATPQAGARAEQQDHATLDASVRENFWNVIWAALVVVLMIPISEFGKSYFAEYTLGKIQVDIQQSLFRKLLTLPLRYHHLNTRGDTLSRTLTDVATAHRGLDLLFSDVTEAAVALLVGLGILFAISWQLTLISLSIAPVVLGLVAVFGRRIRVSAKRRQEKWGDLTQRLIESLSGIKVIKVFGGEEAEWRAFAHDNRKLFRRGMQVVKNRVTSRSLVEMLNNTIAIGMLVLGAMLVLRGQWGLTPGDLAAFIGVLFTTYRHPKAVAKGWNQLMDALPAAERFFEILDAPETLPDAPDAVPFQRLEREIRFRDVSFSYGREPVLVRANFSLRAGEVTALVGRTGAGKTTVADLLLRLYDPDAGAVEFDGVDLRRIARASFLARVAVVTQTPFLFRGSIRENIRYGRPGASETEILAAARAAHVDEFASQLPDGYDTQVGEEGVQLSGGQRQRVTIARAILKNPELLIFDEATSSLDAQSERAVQKAVDALLGGRTAVVIAHRLSTIRHAHRIIVLEHGDAAEIGSHDELMREGGSYADLVSLQNQAPE